MNREQWLTAFADATRPMFEKYGKPLPEIVRISVGWPSKGKRSKTIGECWRAENSGDGAVEIFIRPSLQDDGERIADVLTHELCHAATPGAGHGKPFKALATSLGLEGKMTATVAGDAWRAWARPILADLGRFPAAALSDANQEGGKKKQTTRYLKVACTRCDWQARVTAKHLQHSTLHCPTGCGGNLEQAS